MRTTTEARGLRSTLAIVVAAAALLLVGATPAGAAAGPPRDPSRFGCPPESPNPFTDIDGSVHEAAIRCEAAYGFINGTTSTTFSPSGPVTRGQVASFLARATAYAGVPLDTSDQGFTDISDSVHKDAINALTALGVLNGTTPTTFSPNLPVTRAQGASMVGRLLALGTTDLPNDPPDAFTDDDGSVHEDNINLLAALGIVGGVTSDQFNPNGTVTREAAASILARAQDFGVEVGITGPLGDFDAVLAPLTGAAEVPGPGDAGAEATVELHRARLIDGLLCVTLDFDVALSDTPTAVHVHQGDPHQAGPIVLTIPAPPSGAGLQESCFPDLDNAVLDQIFAHPEDFYVNVHTGDFPDGAVRGQLSPVATRLSTGIKGDEEVPGPGETDADGGFDIEVLADGTTICGFGAYIGTETPTAAHIHEAAAGAAGPVVVTLSPFDQIFSDGCVGDLDPQLVADIAANPEDYYVNVHTDGHPDGAARGQLEATSHLVTTLTGADEVPGPGDPDGSGDADVTLLGDDLLCVRVLVRGIGGPTAAHIHRGDDGVAGTVVVPLPTPTFNSAFGCMDIDPALYDELMTSPDSFYVNVHNGEFPNGALRGQLPAQGQAAGARAGAPMAQAAIRSQAPLRHRSLTAR
jgi:hypothetical protein